ncbi:MAG: GDP-mannose 4,6-dehydratase, partial [bacterium]|nr:GDP-mannose 4,6-dehydratase [bacterium]
GPNSDPNDSRVIPSMVTRALRGLSIHVHGDGKQTRSFCYVSDLVNGLVKLMKSDESMPVNLGNPDEYSILKIAQLIKEATKSSSEIKFIERPEDDPSRRKPDIEKAKQLLGWEPTVSLRTGILKTIRYFTSKNGQ